MLSIVPVPYQEFRNRQIVNGSFEMLEAELDKVRHRAYPDWDDDDSDSDALVEQLNDDNSDTDLIVEEDDETIGLITGVAQLRQYSYHGAEVLNDDLFSDENRMELDSQEQDCGRNNNNCDEHGSNQPGAHDAVSMPKQAFERRTSTSPRSRLSIDSNRSSLSYTDFYIMNSRRSVYAAPVRSRWSTDGMPSAPLDGTNHTIISKRIIEDEDSRAVNHYDLVPFAPSVMSLQIIMATTGTLAPFTQGYASYGAEHEDFRLFNANAQRREEEAEMLELSQQRSVSRRDKNRKQTKNDIVKNVVSRPLHGIGKNFSGYRVRQRHEEVGVQALPPPVAEEQREREALEDLQRRSLEYAGQFEKEKKRDRAMKPVKGIGKKLLGLYKKY